MTQIQQLKNINISLLVERKKFSPRFGNKEDIDIIKLIEKSRKKKDNGKLKIDDEIRTKKYILSLLKKRNEHI